MKRTPLYSRHAQLGAKMVEFAGWEMPVQYPTGIVEEHLRTRRQAGLFEVSHMGRFLVRGGGALAFLQRVLTNDAAALRPGRAQYTMIPTPAGGALDDAYLYCRAPEEYLLVVNAGNRELDWRFLDNSSRGCEGLQMSDLSDELAMLSLQGPESEGMLQGLLSRDSLPEPGRNNHGAALLDGVSATVARTGYTGEPLGFEIFLPAAEAGRLWDRLLGLGASPVGLGARDTLRLEAALPLHGHELGRDPDGREIPILALPLARFAVSLDASRGDFVGREALERQLAARRAPASGRRDAGAPAAPSAAAALPMRVRALSLLDKGIARQGAEVFPAGSSGSPSSASERRLGWVTSGTMAPYWLFEGEGAAAAPGDRTGKRALALALLDRDVGEGTVVEVDIRGRRARALTVPSLLRVDAPPYARPLLWESPVR